MKDAYDLAVEEIDEDLDENIEDLEEHTELQDECFGMMEEDLWDLVAEAQAAAEAYIAAMEEMCNYTCERGGGGGRGGSGGGGSSPSGSSGSNARVYDSKNAAGKTWREEENDRMNRYHSVKGTASAGLSALTGKKKSTSKTSSKNTSKNTSKKTSSINKKASGDMNIDSDDFYNVDEGIGNQAGEELVFHNLQRGRMTYLEKGDAVAPAQITKNIWDFGTNPVEFMLDKLSNVLSSIVGISQPDNDNNGAVILENCTFPLTEVKEASNFAPALQRIAKQNRK